MQEPKYQVVIDWILDGIETGRLQPGDCLMTEEKMSKYFSVSRQTVRRATQELVEKKIVTRIQGSGTYVAGDPQKGYADRHMNIAVISTYCDEYIFPMVLRGIETGLSRKGYSMQLSFTNNKVQRERSILKKLLQENKVDGIIVEPSQSVLENPNLDYYRKIIKQRIPLIFFHDIYPGIKAPCVRLDDYGVAAEAVKLLIREGHEKIGGVFKSDDGQGPRRFAGFRDALEENHELDSRTVVWVDTYLQKHMAENEAYIFDRLAGCTGLVCYNDEVAGQIVEMALRRGIDLPKDLSIISIDNSSLAENGKMPFTSFSHPKDALGRIVADNLLKMIEDPTYDGNYILKVDPVYRDSIRKITNDTF